MRKQHCNLLIPSHRAKKRMTMNDIDNDLLTLSLNSKIPKWYGDCKTENTDFQC